MGRDKRYVRLLDTIQTENRITFRFASDLDVFRKDSFYVDYGQRTCSVPESIKNVPFAAVMAPICWATGADLSLGSLDKAYWESLPKCQEYFRAWNPKNWSFEGSIMAAPVENFYYPHGCGLLFSGGLDSLTSYIKHQNDQPELFTVFGGDIPLDQTAYIDLCKERFSKFSAEQDVPLSFIWTDVMECLDARKLRTFASNWYAVICHSLLLTGLVAPIASATVKTLFIASSHAVNTSLWGSTTELDNRICWAGSRVINDNDDLNRLEKIRKYFKGQERFYKYLHVCWDNLGRYNCSRCEKCLRTMLGLLVNNIDPAKCNFIINDRTLPDLRKKIASCIGFHRLFRNALGGMAIWEQMKVGSPDLEDMYGSRAFFEWMKGEKFQKRQFIPVLSCLLNLLLRVKTALLNGKLIKAEGTVNTADAYFEPASPINAL